MFGSLLSTTAFPSVSAGPSDRIASTIGKFHGVITPTTPIGVRRAVDVRPGVSDGSTCPSGCEIREAAWSSWPIDAVISNAAFGGIAPDSRTIHPVISSRWRSSSSPARRTIAARSVIGSAAQPGCARAADRAAAATDAASATPAVPSTSPVAGSTVSIVSGASIHPSLKIFPVQSRSRRRSSTACAVVLMTRLL